MFLIIHNVSLLMNLIKMKHFVQKNMIIYPERANRRYNVIYKYIYKYFNIKKVKLC